MVNPEFDSPFPGDNEIKRLAEFALASKQKAQDATRMPEDVGIDHVD